METITVNGKMYYSEPQTNENISSTDSYETIIKRFYLNVKKTNKCWLWKRKESNGYGRFQANKNRMLAHRFSYMINRGHILDDMVIHHKCKNKLCVNPKHLEQVTAQKNTNIHYNGDGNGF